MRSLGCIYAVLVAARAARNGSLPFYYALDTQPAFYRLLGVVIADSSTGEKC